MNRTVFTSIKIPVTNTWLRVTGSRSVEARSSYIWTEAFLPYSFQFWVSENDCIGFLFVRSPSICGSLLIIIWDPRITMCVNRGLILDVKVSVREKLCTFALNCLTLYVMSILWKMAVFIYKLNCYEHITNASILMKLSTNVDWTIISVTAILYFMLPWQRRTSQNCHKSQFCIAFFHQNREKQNP
jgi:hypothetical protein